jgi:hypothetical protein
VGTVFALVVSMSAVAVNTPASARPTKTADPRAETADPRAEPYRVAGVRTLAQRNVIAWTGVAIDGIEHGVAAISAIPAEVAELRRLGFTVTGTGGALDFPRADSGYHNYAEMTSEISALVAAHPTIAKKSSAGTSYEGRDLQVIKISDNVGSDENEPEVLFTAHQHAREHLTVEMALYLVHMLLESYGTDARVTNLVNSREIWILPDVNPDGGEYDVASGSYRSWRKNRQPNSGSSAVGTDPNRNWAYRWACCGGSSGVTSSETYHGPGAFSAPETKRVADWVRGRAVGGRQQIAIGIDFHTYSELVLWPYGYTTADGDARMTADQYNTFATIGKQLAATNGYTPEEASELYLADGSINDWAWGDQGIFEYTFEMYPTNEAAGGFYPPASVIAAQTSRNSEAVLRLLEYADCPYRAIGKQAQYCGPTKPVTTVYSDSFETATAWVTNPAGTDTATTGKWERGVPEATDSAGPKQLAVPASGANDLVTGRLAGSGAGVGDIDGGVTSVQSPPIVLPPTGTPRLSFSYYLAYGANASSADYFKISIVTANGVTVVLTVPAAATNYDAGWTVASIDLSAFTGQSVRILVAAADAAGASLVEAAIDDVKITA